MPPDEPSVRTDGCKRPGALARVLRWDRGKPTFHGGKAMRSIRRELETKREALTSAISSTTRSRDDDHRREVFKDPFGMASITHDDEVVAAVVDTRARQLEEIDRALADIDAGRYGICRSEEHTSELQSLRHL